MMKLISVIVIVSLFYKPEFVIASGSPAPTRKEKPIDEADSGSGTAANRKGLTAQLASVINSPEGLAALPKGQSSPGTEAESPKTKQRFKFWRKEPRDTPDGAEAQTPKSKSAPPSPAASRKLRRFFQRSRSSGDGDISGGYEYINDDGSSSDIGEQEITKSPEVTTKNPQDQSVEASKKSHRDLVIRVITVSLTEETSMSIQYLRNTVANFEGQREGVTPDLLFVVVTAESGELDSPFQALMGAIEPERDSLLSRFKLVDYFVGAKDLTVSFIFQRAELETDDDAIEVSVLPSTSKPKRGRGRKKRFIRVSVRVGERKPMVLAILPLNAVKSTGEYQNLVDLEMPLYSGLNAVGNHHVAFVAGRFNQFNHNIIMNGPSYPLSESDKPMTALEKKYYDRAWVREKTVPYTFNKDTWAAVSNSFDSLTEYLRKNQLVTLAANPPKYPPSFVKRQSGGTFDLAWPNQSRLAGPLGPRSDMIELAWEGSVAGTEEDYACPTAFDYTANVNTFAEHLQEERTISAVTIELNSEAKRRIPELSKNTAFYVNVFKMKENDGSEHWREKLVGGGPIRKSDLERKTVIQLKSNFLKTDRPADIFVIKIFKKGSSSRSPSPVSREGHSQSQMPAEAPVLVSMPMVASYTDEQAAFLEGKFLSESGIYVGSASITVST